MTTLVSRTPLQTLSMSASQQQQQQQQQHQHQQQQQQHQHQQQRQRPARRSARLAFDDDGDDENAPAKRTKVSGRVNGNSKRKAKAAYDEEDDGFAFARKGSKKSQSKTTTSTATVPAVESVSEPAKAPSVTQQQRRKKTSMTPVASSDDSLAPKRRRSTRLSVEKEQTVIQMSEEALPKGSKRAANPQAVESGDTSPNLVGRQTLKVDKLRETRIALPFADTPVIRRNKEMRAKKSKTSTSSHRRSSTGMRGRRASSLIESGTSNAVPHADVDVRDFYKHIENGLPEPRRMRQLLAWCGTRAMPEKVQGAKGDTTELLANDAARHIQEELLKDFASKEEMSDWFSREETVAATTLVKKPNPRNMQNAAKIRDLEQEIKRLEDEQRAWKSLLPSSKSPSQPQHQPEPSDSENIDASLLGPSQANLLSILDLSNTTTTTSSSSTSSSQTNTNNKPSALAQSTSTRVRSLVSTLEPTLDALADGIHRLSQYNLSASRIAERIQHIGAERLNKRDQQARAVGDMRAEIGGRDTLRALSRVLSDKGR